MTRSGVFLTNFEVFHLVMKQRVECLILLKQLILEGEIMAAKMSSFSSDFQTLIKHSFLLYFLHELLMSLKKFIPITVDQQNKSSQSLENCFYL